MKRNYRNNLKFVESGFRACWRNVADLLDAGHLLIDAKRFSVALSLSVLAMEEVGKMMLLDGLLFSRAGDHKGEHFRSGHTKHQEKLQFVDLFPFFVTSLATADPRYDAETRFRKALDITILNLKKERLVLSRCLGANCDLTELDSWKQHGFYASDAGDKLLSPQDRVPEDLAKAVHTLAWRLKTTLDFLLKDGNLERYFERARVLRDKFTEADHELLERYGSEIADELFGDRRTSSTPKRSGGEPAHH